MTKPDEPKRRRQRGMTLLEIMIVLAIVGLVMGLVVGPAVMKMFEKSKDDITRMKIEKYAHEAYPQWAMSTRKACPESLVELHEHMNIRSKEANDGWDRPLEMTCGANNPPGVTGLAVWSHGQDGKPQTADDIRSWD